MQRSVRMKREIQMMSESPPHGISCWPKDDKIDHLEAQIVGGEGTPYEGGIFKLEIQIPERYPFEPPRVRYVTPIYHPNIDNGGRICLDTLKMPPKGAWKPCLNVSTLLTSLQLLMAEPNPDDPLMTDIANEFKYNRVLYNAKAREWTEKHAMQKTKPVLSVDILKEPENSNSVIRKGKDVSDSVSSGLKRPSAMSDVTNKHVKLSKTGQSSD